MNAKYSAEAAVKRMHAKANIERNAKTVQNNFGTAFRITASRRVLGVLNYMTGKYEAPSLNDGLLFKAGYFYLPKTTSTTAS